MLNKILSFSIRNKLIVILLTALVGIWGGWSVFHLSVDAVPDITNNQVQVITVCPSLAGQEVEQLVTFPLEQSLANTPGLEELRSISRFGLSVITVVFTEETDVYFARQLIHERITRAVGDIPDGVGTPEMAPVSTGLGEIYQYVLHPKKGSESKYSATELRTMQDWIVARQLNGIPGVAEINSFGGSLKQYEVAVNPEKLQSMGVSISEILSTLEDNNENTGGAYIDKKPHAYFIRGIGLVTSLEDVANMVVRLNPNGVPLLIRDVAEVKIGSAIRYGAMTYNGEKDAVGGVVMMLKGANSEDVIKMVEERVQSIKRSLPEDVIIEPFLNRSDLVSRAMGTVKKNLIEGALIVIFVLVLFLGNFRAGLIVASAIPLSMLFAMGMMKVLGISANLMSLGAIDFGLIVDGAVIVVEAAMHSLNSRAGFSRLTRKEMDEQVYLSSSKIRNSAAFGEIIILAVYIPVLSLSGIEGKMFKPMAETVGLAIVGALLLSLTYIPAMCALFLPREKSSKLTISDRIMNFLKRGYEPLLRSALRLKWILISSVVLLFGVSLFFFSRLGGEFIPTLQEGEFAFHCILPQGTSLSQSVETSMQAMRIIRTEFEEVKMVVGKTGSAEVPTDPMPPETSDMIVILKDKEDWKRDIEYNQLGEEILSRLQQIPGVYFERSQPIQMRFNELMTGVRQDVAIKVFGEDMDTLVKLANEISTLASKVEGVKEPAVERVEGLPQISIRYKRDVMATYGLSVKQVSQTINAAFAGAKAGMVYENERRFDLVVRLDSQLRNCLTSPANLYIGLPDGHQVPLSQVAEIVMDEGPAQISREDGKRRVVIGFNIAGRDVESIVAEIGDKLQNEIKMPEGTYYTFGGTFENLVQARNRLIIAVPVALMIIFLLLYFTFHSFRYSLLIFTSIPLSAIGGIMALMMRGMPFSISAGIGFIALFGVAVLNGIVLVSTFNQLQKEDGNDIFKLVINGSLNRLRPVLMTAVVASLGFIPMAFSDGTGAEIQKPLATVVIGGLVSATILTLFVLPVLYFIIHQPFNMKKTSGKNIALLLILGFIQINDSHAQIHAVSRDSAISICLKNHPLIQADKSKENAVMIQKRSVYALPDASVSLQYGQYNSFYNDLGFSFSQVIPFPGEFAGRERLNEVERNRASYRTQWTENELRTEIRVLYNEYEFLHNQGKILSKYDSIYVKLDSIASLRYRLGESALSESALAKSKLLSNAILLKQNTLKKNQVLIQIQNLLQFQDTFELDIPQKYSVYEILNPMDTIGVLQNPLLLVGGADAKYYEQSASLQKNISMPDLSLQYNNQSLTGFQNVYGTEEYFGPGKRFSTIQIGVLFPLNIRAETSKVKSLELLKDASLRTLKSEENKLNANLQGYAQIYSNGVLILTEIKKASNMLYSSHPSAMYAAYINGESNYLDYVKSLELLMEAEQRELNLIYQINYAACQILNIKNQ